MSHHRNDNRRPVAVELGEWQARALADELNEGMAFTLAPVLATWSEVLPEPPPQITWERILQGDAWVFGALIRGVESPDYLNVVSEPNE